MIEAGRAKTLPRSPEGVEPRQGHARWGFETVEAFETARERVRDMRLRDNSPEGICRQTGLSTEFVKAALDFWKYHKVEFPRVTRVRGQAGDRARA